MNSIELSRNIRLKALRMVHRANASHIGGVLSMADILGVLYADILRVNSANPQWSERDRFILSKGHCCAGVYAALALTGFFPEGDLEQYGQEGSVLMTHISHKVPGVEFSTGSLGHGLPFAAGKAFAAKKRNAHWRTYCVLSDGELNEGSNWEAILFAAHHKLAGLIAVVDYNGIQSLGRLSDILELEPLADKFRAFRWNVLTVDGHDHEALRDALSIQSCGTQGPTCVIARTIKGKGVPFMEGLLKWHYSSPTETQLLAAMSALNENSIY